MSTGAKYAKIDDAGKLVYAPSILKTSTGGFIINPSEKTLLKESYLPADEVIPPHDDNDLVMLDHYEIVDGRIVVTYKVVEISDSDEGATPEEVAELEEQIATLKSQNAILASQKAELTAANETIDAERIAQMNLANSYQDSYLSEHSKVLGLESDLKVLQERYSAEKELQDELAYYREAAIKANYLTYIDRQIATDTILCYGGRIDESNASDSEDDTEYYKHAHIESKFEFEPLKTYRVTNGHEDRFLVYTPPDKSIVVGGVPYPIVEAHGGDWVELDISDSMSADISDSASNDGIDGYGFRVFVWQDMEGQYHCGTSVPDDAFWVEEIVSNSPQKI